MEKTKLLELIMHLLDDDKESENDQNPSNGYSDYTGKYVVVSTDETKRGVFFGKLKYFDRENQVIVLNECQMAVRWSTTTKGFNNLAVQGPQSGSRITKPVLEQELNGVSCVMLATQEATKEWKKEKWDS